MTEATDSADTQMRDILEMLLAEDAVISARAVARLHPMIKAASSITRSASRSRLLAEYQDRQAQYRRWRGRVSKTSGKDVAAAITDKETRIAELEATVQLLTASHLAMLRAVGELGGFAKWAKFYEHHQAIRGRLVEIGATPIAAVTALSGDTTKRRLSTTKLSRQGSSRRDTKP
jgi:hypothetical protein